MDDPIVTNGIACLQEDYGVGDEDFLAMCTRLYAVYLTGMAKNPLAKTAELKELTGLKAALHLENQQTGQAHANDDTNFYTNVTPPPPSTSLTTGKNLTVLDSTSSSSSPRGSFFGVARSTRRSRLR